MRKEHFVSDEQAGRHLRNLLEEILANVPAKGIRRAVQRGQIVVNKNRVPSNYKLATGDLISIHIQTTGKKYVGAYIPVIQEDDHYAIINKPAGLPVGGGRGATVSDGLVHFLKPSGAHDALLIPRAVHRLDKPTSGLLLIAKTKSALADLSQQFEARSVQKTYIAVVNGHVKNAGEVEILLEEKTAFTYYTPLRQLSNQGGNFTIVELTPKTGRTHQLRKHMAFIGHAIFGDYKYGKLIPEKETNLMLCATKLVFKHPHSNAEIQCKIETPPDFYAI